MYTRAVNRLVLKYIVASGQFNSSRKRENNRIVPEGCRKMFFIPRIEISVSLLSKITLMVVF